MDLKEHQVGPRPLTGVCLPLSVGVCVEGIHLPGWAGYLPLEGSQCPMILVWLLCGFWW